jgi:hypothetical protein
MLQVDLPVSASRGHLANPNTITPSTPAPWNKAAAIFIIIAGHIFSPYRMAKVLDNFQERHVRPISIICALRKPGYGQGMISKRSYDEEGNAASTFFSHYISIGPLIKNEVKVRNLAAPMECACLRAQAPSFVPFLSRDGVQTLTAIHLGSVQLDHVV